MKPVLQEALVKAMRDCADRGLTMRDAAAELGYGYSHLTVLARQHGIKFTRTWGGIVVGAREISQCVSEDAQKRFADREARCAQMRGLYESGKTLEDIGKVYGVTRERVRQILRKDGVAPEAGGKKVRSLNRLAMRKQKDEQFCLSKHGCTREQYRELIAIGKRMVAAGARRDRTPTGAFIRQRKNAEDRSIEWRLTVWQWWTIWQASGKWDQRGRAGYVMCRYDDVGAYEVGNVYIASARHNSSFGNNESGLPTGVSFKGKYKTKPFVAQAQIGGKKHHFGKYPTPELAHAAYVAGLRRHGAIA